MAENAKFKLRGIYFKLYQLYNSSSASIQSDCWFKLNSLAITTCSVLCSNLEFQIQNLNTLYWFGYSLRYACSTTCSSGCIGSGLVLLLPAPSFLVGGRSRIVVAVLRFPTFCLILGGRKNHRRIQWGGPPPQMDTHQGKKERIIRVKHLFIILDQVIRA